MAKKIFSRPGAMIALVLKTLFQKPATVDYPNKPMPMTKNFRGKLNFLPEKCIGCLICMKDCPTDAIEIKKLGDKKFEMDIDLGKCIYCGQCVDSCPKKALAITPNFELAQFSHDKLRIVFNADGPEGGTDQPS
ncbi:MAG: 4Fe-4S binding protein [Candidatus Margulisiibacteriota bacterium]